ncbi:MAG TPA: GntR family transcriptional regulator [Gemmatimonadaceae bacterium]|nr:GntR family transcriptional regulator [Gemmatimonadaceae bacterium]
MRVNSAARARRYATSPDRIADALRDEILRGAIGAGEPLRQEELAARFQVSRIPIRDALLRLEAQGLVQVYPNRGAFVVSLSADDIREIYDLRLLLEGDILERAVPRLSVDDWRRIDAAHAEATRTAGTADWLEGDWTFHRALYEPAGRPRQLEMIEQLRGTVARYSAAPEILPDRTPDWLADHEAILQACRARSSVAARKRLESHLRAAADLVLGAGG